MWLKGQSERQKEIRNKNRMRKNRWRKILLGVLVLMAAIIATICFVFSPFSPDSTRTVTVGGETYKQKDGITTILLLGIDKRETLENESGQPAYNGQSDMLWLLVVDREKNHIQVITVPRETMADVEEHYSDGSTRKVYEQICLQYAYGTTPEEGCELTETAVKNLLQEAPVDYTCAVSMGAITKLVDAVGGVDIVMSNDYSVPDENGVDFVQYTAGCTVHMDGETAYRFIHYRDVDHLYTNLDRMNRQQDFLMAFATPLQELIKSRPWEIPGLLKELKAYYYTDLSFAEILRLSVTVLSADLSEIERIQIPGREVHVGRYDQYLPKEEELQEMILEIFYEKSEGK